MTTEPSVHEPAFVDEENVLLCPAMNAQALSDAILRIFADPKLLHSLRAGSNELATKWFSWDSAIASIATALRGPGQSDLNSLA